MDKVELKKSFAVMAKMQDDLNAKVNPSWRHADYPFWRALWTELGEASDYVQWAWWKNVGIKTFTSEKNRLQFFLEMADALHFGISVTLQNKANARGGAFEEANSDYQMLAEELADAYDHAYSRIIDRDGSLIELVERVAVEALGHHTFNASYFFAACYRAGLSIGALVAYYHGKNLLNHFRQEHGYKQGTYQKNWGTAEQPEEDNVSLAGLIEEFRSRVGDANVLPAVNSGNFQNWLRQELHRKYLELTRGTSDD